ncbi:MAG: sigma-54-dependent Fis family transcriptional regulator [bacterium]|nr:sigma-54-dependent Fis family transcriptional regulator [bacterium]
MSRIMLIDDDTSLREVVAFTLREQGHEVDAHGTGESAFGSIESFRPDVVITDLKMPGIDGMEVLRRVADIDATIPVIMLTAFGSITDAVEAMRHGAYDYLTKPYDRDELRLTIEQALERRRLLLENRTLRDRLHEETRRVEFVHASAAMQEILAMIRRIAPTEATVLLTGESGTGKEVLAHALHSCSDRWDKPFVAIDCAAIPRDLMESELFGHTKGAFTGAVKDKPGKFQRADGGTLLLDEIGDLPPELQTKLLRVIETRLVDVVGGQQPVPVDVRLIAATNADLEEKVQRGEFRHDLYYRLHVIPIHIPPLRARTDDIPALWEHFVRRYAGDSPVRSSPGLVRALMARRWPGNVRELANVCQRLVLLRSTDVLQADDLPPEEQRSGGPGGEAVTGGGPSRNRDAGRSSGDFLGELPHDQLSLNDVERDIIVRALAKYGGNRSRTAAYLRIPRHVLLYRLEKFEIK